MTARDASFGQDTKLPVVAAAEVRAPAAVEAGDTIGEAARAIIGYHLRQLRAHEPGTRLGDDPEALHDMRVATRRLRAAVRVLSPGIRSRLRASLDQDLEWLGQCLGTVRDLDVQIGHSALYGAAMPRGHRNALRSFRVHLERERAIHRVEMLKALSSPRYSRLLTRMERFAESVPPRRGGARQPLAVVGGRALQDAFRRLLKRGRTLHAAPAPEDLHALRIRAKRLRYMLEFLREVIGKPGRRLIKRLVRLQDVLGAYHDHVVAAEYVRAYVEGSGAQQPPATLLTLGAFVAQELHRAEEQRASLHAVWKRFVRQRTLADFRSMMRHLEMMKAADS